MRVENGLGSQRHRKETASCRGSHPSCVSVGLVQTAGNLWHCHRHRWHWRVGWSWSATSVCVCHHRSEKLSTDQMYVFFAQKLRRELRASGMNLLSGTTWKGAKLRIGEAKPDFRERYDTPHPCGSLPINRFLPLSQDQTRERGVSRRPTDQETSSGTGRSRRPRI